MRNARFVQVGSRKGRGFVSVSEGGRGCGFRVGLGDKWPKRWTFGQKQGLLFRLRRGIEPFSDLFRDKLVPALGWLRRVYRRALAQWLGKKTGSSFAPGNGVRRNERNQRNEKPSNHLRVFWCGETSEMSFRTTQPDTPASAYPACR